jgi:hypothetical protein
MAQHGDSLRARSAIVARVSCRPRASVRRVLEGIGASRVNVRIVKGAVQGGSDVDVARAASTGEKRSVETNLICRGSARDCPILRARHNGAHVDRQTGGGINQILAGLLKSHRSNQRGGLSASISHSENANARRHTTVAGGVLVKSRNVRHVDLISRHGSSTGARQTISNVSRQSQSSLDVAIEASGLINVAGAVQAAQIDAGAIATGKIDRLALGGVIVVATGSSRAVATTVAGANLDSLGRLGGLDLTGQNRSSNSRPGLNNLASRNSAANSHLSLRPRNGNAFLFSHDLKRKLLLNRNYFENCNLCSRGEL